MKIFYEFNSYRGYVFRDENKNIVSYKDIKDKFFILDGRKGKLVNIGYTNIYEQGFCGGYENYGFVFQDDLAIISLDKCPNGILLESV